MHIYSIMMYTYQVEYIWIGGNDEFRSKVRCFPSDLKPTDRLFHRLLEMDWNYDGSSTNQALTEDSEVLIIPIRTYADRVDSTKYYVLCDTFRVTLDEKGDRIKVPLENNYRTILASNWATTAGPLDIWFGFEQEFFIFDCESQTMLGNYTDMPQQGPYYCAVEAVPGYTYGKNSRSIHSVRSITEAITKRCIDIGLGITGWNLEVAPGQTEIQIFGKGLKACDDLMMLRYLIHRVLNDNNMRPIFDPKPLGAGWNGSGLHANISTEATRVNGGIATIHKYLTAFEATHAEHIAVYGDGNKDRLTGIHETSSMDKFSWSVGGRNTSVRIPRSVDWAKCGYFEDRRPAANANPYRIAKRVIDTIS